MTYNHYYSVYNNGNLTDEFVINILNQVVDGRPMMKGWFPLGTISVKPGTIQVRLSDKSDEPNTLIYADAVRFVRK